VEPTHNNVDVSWLAFRFGIRPSVYEADDRIRALLEHKEKLDRTITEARKEIGEHDYKIVQNRQSSSLTKTALLDKIVAKFGFNVSELKESQALRYLVGGVADATIYLAVLRRPIAKPAKAVVQ
jgi:hypothetical protein